MGHLLKVYVQPIELAHRARLRIVVPRWFAVKTLGDYTVAVSSPLKESVPQDIPFLNGLLVRWSNVCALWSHGKGPIRFLLSSSRPAGVRAFDLVAS